MRRDIVFLHEFVEHIPDHLPDGMIYVSITFSTAVHMCACGCRREVVTPLSPTDWQLLFDGESVSLTPSIGNWGFPCRSHYWIRHNKVQWARKWPQREIDAGRTRERLTRYEYFNPEPQERREGPNTRVKRNGIAGRGSSAYSSDNVGSLDTFRPGPTL